MVKEVINKKVLKVQIKQQNNTILYKTMNIKT
jgi:hypothetical protein